MPDTSAAGSVAPTNIHLHKRSGILELGYGNASYELSAEFLRVHSPSAEVRGHGKGQGVLQTGKKNVLITAIEPVGNYAVQLRFDDGHSSGIYSWEYLHQLATRHDDFWRDYLRRLEQAGASRVPLPTGAQVINIQPLNSDR